MGGHSQSTKKIPQTVIHQLLLVPTTILPIPTSFHTQKPIPDLPRGMSTRKRLYPSLYAIVEEKYGGKQRLLLLDKMGGERRNRNRSYAKTFQDDEEALAKKSDMRERL